MGLRCVWTRNPTSPHRIIIIILTKFIVCELLAYKVGMRIYVYRPWIPLGTFLDPSKLMNLICLDPLWEGATLGYILTSI